MKTQYMTSITFNTMTCSAVFWKHVWVSFQGVRLCYSTAGFPRILLSKFLKASIHFGCFEFCLSSSK